MQLVAEWILPIITVSELNTHEHWSISHKRHKLQQNQVKLRYRQEGLKFDPPAHIVLTRLSPRNLDSDAIGGAMKWVRDALADCVIPGLQAGRADDVKYGLTWQTEQEIAKIRGVKIQIYKQLHLTIEDVKNLSNDEISSKMKIMEDEIIKNMLDSTEKKGTTNG